MSACGQLPESSQSPITDGHIKLYIDANNWNVNRIIIHCDNKIWKQVYNINVNYIETVRLDYLDCNRVYASARLIGGDVYTMDPLFGPQAGERICLYIRPLLSTSFMTPCNY